MGDSERGKRRTMRELRVVLDTSALHSGSEAYLVRKEIEEMVETNKGHRDLIVMWYLPSVVLHERQAQMKRKAREYVPTIDKLEKLLGQKLNVTEDRIDKRIEEAIREQIMKLGLQELELDKSKVDLDQLMMGACYRNPPFDKGEKEKGFRDALVVESLLQLVEKSPKAAARCRIVLVSGDKLIGEAVLNKTVDMKNIRVVESTEELKGLINTLVEAVTEDFIASIFEDARILFFNPDEKEGLFYKKGIKKKIRRKYKSALEEIPAGCEERKNSKVWRVGKPRFVKKEGQTVFWASRITVEAEAYRQGVELSFPSSSSTSDSEPMVTDWYSDYQPFQSPTNLGSTGLVISGTTGLTLPPGTGINLTAAGNTEEGIWLSGLPEYGTGRIVKQLVYRGESVFEVKWSVLVTTRRRMSKEKIVEINYVGTNWA